MAKGQIWIDLDNAPHVPFFAPIINELRARGFQVWVTVSGRHQVQELAEMLGIPHVLCKGGYFGKRKLLKVIGIATRAAHLMRAASRSKPRLALSHGSRPQMVAANILGIPAVVIIDYEFVQLPFVKIDRLIIPEVIPGSAVRNCGQVSTYSGIKEEVYIPDFKPAASTLGALGISGSKVVAVVRPPATEAHYHNIDSEDLFRYVVRRLAENDDCVIVMLPRSTTQELALSSEWSDMVAAGKVVIPENALCGLSLIWECDLVVSGGGTMNREAAALGVPVYSIFSGRLGAVDRFLCDSGRMTLLASAEDVDRLLLVQKRERHERPPEVSRKVLNEIVAHVVAAFESASSPQQGA